MLNRTDTREGIKERLKQLVSSDICALFLIAVETDGSDVVGGWTAKEVMEYTDKILSRFFRTTDIIGQIGENQFAVFLTGKLTGHVILEKARLLSETLHLISRDISYKKLVSYVGVYSFQDHSYSIEYILRKAEYALELARKEVGLRFYLLSELKTDDFRMPSHPDSSFTFLNYIDEGVRLLKMGETLETVYVSPGFCRRLSFDQGTFNISDFRIHPDDQSDYEKKLQRTAETGEAQDGKYHISIDGEHWISCRYRLLKISISDQIPGILEISHNIEGLKRLEKQFNEKKLWLQFVAEQTDYQLWEVDLRARTLHMLYTRKPLDGRQTIYENFPESLVESGRVHCDSAERFLRFASGMFSGRVEDSGNFALQYRQSSCYGWAALSYRILYDEDGKPEKAIGIKEELSYLPAQQSRFIQRRVMLPDLYPHLYCYLQVNLSKDAVEKYLLAGRERVRLLHYQTFSDLLDRGLFRLFMKEHVKKLRNRYNRSRLLEEYAHGTRWFFDKCRIIDTWGTIRWVNIGVNLCEDPETKDICLFAYLSNSNQLHILENRLNAPINTDPITGVYSIETEEQLIRHLSDEKKKSSDSCALVVISIDGAEEVFKNDGASQQFLDIITAFHVALDTDCLVGWGSSHRLLVFFPQIESKIRLKRRLENTFSFVRISLGGMRDMRTLRFIAGVSWSNFSDFCYEPMLRAAHKSCTLAEGEASDIVVFAENYEESGWSEFELSDRSMENLTPVRPLSGLPLTDREKDMVIQCLGDMLNTDSARNSLDAVLRRIGNYYRADRAYILTLTENNTNITMVNEWVRKGKYSIQQTISGKRTEQFPVISHFARHPAPIILTRKERLRPSGKSDEAPWQYVILPLDHLENELQLLCIENPRNLVKQTALLDTLIPYLGKERNRFFLRSQERTPSEQLLSLPSLQDCMATADSITSDTYSSLGVLSVDIFNYLKLKELRGYEFGMQFILKIFEVLSNVFGDFLLFRTQEAEFVVLCTNTTYDFFLNQCARVRQLVGKSYHGLFRIGTSWSDGIFRARNLIQKARSIMHCATPTQTVENALLKNQKPSINLDSSLAVDGEESGSFTIYLQPKIDMKSGKLIGAEALARVLDANGNLLPHVRIIESMEKNGTISKLDYFVFDKTLSVLSQWKDKGYGLVPISSNFSRNTLLNPSALASVLAILSRYPEISQDLVELEITETAGDYENNTFADLIRRFGSYGLLFSLDDFGSSYSNLSMLVHLHFHSVKLDRSLIKEIAVNSVSRLMVKDLIKLCRRCGMQCIAEGVETAEQVSVLLEDGCTCAQGYYYDRPMSVQKFEEKYFGI